MKTKLAIEAGAVGGHQIKPLNVTKSWTLQQGFHDFPAKTATLQVSSHHDVPEDGAVDPIAAGSPEANQALSAPEAHHHGAAFEHAAQITHRALLCPEGVLAKQPLQFQ